MNITTKINEPISWADQWDEPQRELENQISLLEFGIEHAETFEKANYYRYLLEEAELKLYAFLHHRELAGA